MRSFAACLLTLACGGAAIGADGNAAPPAKGGTPAVAPAQTSATAAAIAPGADANTFEATRKTASYQVGVAFSNQLRTFHLLPDEFVRGILEASSGKAKPLDPGAMQELMNHYTEMLGKQQVKENADFFVTNAKKAGVKVLSDGVQYEVLASGNGRTPTTTDQVKVNYRGTFPDGTEFDASAKHGGPFTFTVGTGVIKSWSDTLVNMKEGDKWRIYVPPELGYGERGAPPQIPANQILVFEIELVQVLPPSGNVPGLNR